MKWNEVCHQCQSLSDVQEVIQLIKQVVQCQLSSSKPFSMDNVDFHKCDKKHVEWTFVTVPETEDWLFCQSSNHWEASAKMPPTDNCMSTCAHEDLHHIVRFLYSVFLPLLSVHYPAWKPFQQLLVDLRREWPSECPACGPCAQRYWQQLQSIVKHVHDNEKCHTQTLSTLHQCIEDTFRKTICESSSIDFFRREVIQQWIVRYPFLSIPTSTLDFDHLWDYFLQNYQLMERRHTECKTFTTLYKLFLRKFWVLLNLYFTESMLPVDTPITLSVGQQQTFITMHPQIPLCNVHPLLKCYFLHPFKDIDCVTTT